VAGARAALLKSEKITVADLERMLATTGQKARSRKPTREELVKALISAYDKRINKTIDELRGLSEEAIRNYLQDTNCSTEELMSLLEREKLPYRKGLSRSQLIQAAARQISSLGVYQRIADARVPDENVGADTDAKGTSDIGAHTRAVIDPESSASSPRPGEQLTLASHDDRHS
jgi:hypothetical protein